MKTQMNERQRFAAVMDYSTPDRLPCYIFGFWDETLKRWQDEGLDSNSPPFAQLGLDSDWEGRIWAHHDMLDMWRSCDQPVTVLEDNSEWQTVRNGFGDIIRSSKIGSSINQHLEYGFEPTRDYWNRIIKPSFDPATPGRFRAGWKQQAMVLSTRANVACCLGGSLYGTLRDWMGVEKVSYLMYDDPALLDEMLDWIANFFVTMYTPVVPLADFDFVYFWEDCCGKSGPLFSPAIYRKHFHKYYQRMIEAYRKLGLKHFLIDSDGWVDALTPCWIESGFDILFPLEPGTWGGDPRDFRNRFGRELRMMGGVDKHIIARGDHAIREELKKFRDLAADGGYLPMPDHRIPPEVSLDAMRRYIAIYKEVFS
jgi:uroporphyrinogen decarboxylase